MQIYPSANFIGFVVVDGIFILTAGLFTIIYYFYVMGYFGQAKEKLTKHLTEWLKLS